MNKFRFSLRRLFSNTKFLIVFSVVVAFIFWIVVALQYAPIVENVIKNVPVQIDLENSVPDKMGLQIFGQKDFTVDISVSGSRYIVGGELLSPSDFEVTAQTAYVNSAGNHMLQLKVTAKDPESNFDIIGLSSDYIEVYFDTLSEKDISVTPRIITELNSLTDEGFLFDEDEIITNTEFVHISGAKTEIDSITDGYIDINIDTKLKETITQDSAVTFVNRLGESVKYITVNGSENYTMPVTLPVYKVETLPASVAFKNSPSNYLKEPLNYTCYPSSVKVAVLQNGSVNDSLQVGTIDFNSIDLSSNLFSFDTDEIDDVKILDGTRTVKVRIDTSGLTKAEFEIDSGNIVFENKDDAMNVQADTSTTGKITVIGSREDILKLNINDIIGSVDYDLSKLSGKTAQVPMSVMLKNSNSCWVAGEYTVIAKIK